MKNQTIEEVLAELKKLEPTRQHGRKGESLSDLTAELKRLKNNLASRLCRARMKEAGKPTSKQAVKENDHGITDADLRRFKQCYVYESILPTLSYIKRMTGLTDVQIQYCCKKTKLGYAKC